MNLHTLEKVISDCLSMGVSVFSWQGGEPTLMGLDFFKKAVEFQIKHAQYGACIANALQTNGILINEEWAEFLAEYNFLVGLSLDGPEAIHNKYRKDYYSKGTFKKVMNAARHLHRYGAEFNILVLINNVNVCKPNLLYDFLVENGFKYLQFIPCIEVDEEGQPKDFSVSPEAYSDFLIAVFDRWLKDFPNVFVRDFDTMLAQELNEPGSVCYWKNCCGDYVVIEHNGDVFACDFFVKPEFNLGNILENSLCDIIQSPILKNFSAQKSVLPKVCQTCEFAIRCMGGCLKHRGLANNFEAPNYFCKAYKNLFQHAKNKLSMLAQRIGKLN